MRLPGIAWAFFALAALLAAGHILLAGIFVGSEVKAIQRPYGVAYVHECHYLFLNGIHEVIDPQVVIQTKKEASQYSCPLKP
jgi:hypothetical protein